MPISLVRGTTSKRRRIFIQDNSVVTGAGLTGLLFNSSGLTWYYIRENQGASVQVTLQTMTLGTWASGGFIEVDATHMNGWYEIGIPDAALVSGNSVQLHLQGATNMVPVVLDIELTGWDNQNATSGGLSNLDAAISTRSTFAGGSVSSVTGDVAGKVLGGGAGVLSAVGVQADVEQWKTQTVVTPAVTGVPKVDVVDWIGSTPDALSSGKLPVDVKLWLASAPSSLNSGLVQSDVERWLNGAIPAVNVTGVPKVDLVDWLGSAPDALSSGKLPADVKLWLTSAPAALTSSGYVQAMLLRWLTDNAGGTPNVLSSGLVQSDVYKAGGTTITAGDFVDYLLRLKAALIPTTGTVNDAGASTTSFITDLSSAVDNFYVGDILIFTSGSLAGQSRHISSYAQSTKTVTLISALTSAPANGVSFTLSSSSQDLGLIKQDTANTLSRLGAFTGSGANTILGLFQSLFRSDASLPSDIGGTYNNATMSLQGLYAKIIHIPEGLALGVAYPNFKFIMRSSTNHVSLATGLTITAQRSIDTGSFSACTNPVVEIANGSYRIDLSSSDLNGTSILLYFTASGADPAFYVLKTT